MIAGHVRKQNAFKMAALLVACGWTSSVQAVLRHQYTFNGSSAQDLIGTAHGTLFGAATVVDGVLNLPGASGDYASLPGSNININNGANYIDATFEAWFTWNGSGGNWQRVFDFGAISGTSGQDYVFYTPVGGASRFQRAATRDNAAAEVGYSTAGGTAVTPDVRHHVAVVVDDNANGGANTISLYFNGNLLGSGTLQSGSTYSMSGLSNANAFLGRSLFSADAYFNGSIDEFRVYNHALNLTEVQTSFAAGPVPLPGLQLNVNTFTGQVEIANPTPGNFLTDYYRITSANGALNPATWNSLDDQNADAIGPDPGQSWDETGIPSENEVIESFLLGTATMSANSGRNLGQLFDPSVFGKRQNGDLVFEYAIAGRPLRQGTINYITPPGLLGDYNDDGLVDAADYTVYRNRASGIGGTTLPAISEGATPGTVTIEDYQVWKDHYGEVLGLGSGGSIESENVPEPTTLILASIFGLATAGLGRGRRT
jgi:hypothetical protein